MATTDKADSDTPILVLFRHDLRIADNRALSSAADSRRPVVPVFILDEVSAGVRPIGAARRWWLHHSLEALGASFMRLGAPLSLRRGAMEETVQRLLEESGADTVLWNRRYDPPEIAVDAAMKKSLSDHGVRVESFDGHLLHEPSLVKTGSGGSYKVYSPFWRALVAGPEPRDPVDAPKSLRAGTSTVETELLRDWSLLPQKPDWAGGMRDAWTPGEAGAHDSLDDFLAQALDGYDKNRDVPGIRGTSRLSPHLAHGEITPFQIFAALRSDKRKAAGGDAEKFRKEVAWREFAYHLLFHHPALSSENYNPDFDDFPWASDDANLKAWRQGRTGYPIVDAGMRQLWRTGWMHNRVRMIVASFLIKHLLIDWRVGERWFWDTLVDADCANNPASWQWVAGSGADAAPYFRIFNPILQGEKFDPEGSYVRQFVPELGDLPDKYLHRPWEAPKEVLAAAGVKLGRTYPVPVIDHGVGRDQAMAAYKKMRGDL